MSNVFKTCFVCGNSVQYMTLCAECGSDEYGVIELKKEARARALERYHVLKDALAACGNEQRNIYMEIKALNRKQRVMKLAWKKGKKL